MNEDTKAPAHLTDALSYVMTMLLQRFEAVQPGTVENMLQGVRGDRAAVDVGSSLGPVFDGAEALLTMVHRFNRMAGVGAKPSLPIHCDEDEWIERAAAALAEKRPVLRTREVMAIVKGHLWLEACDHAPEEAVESFVMKHSDD